MDEAITKEEFGISHTEKDAGKTEYILETNQDGKLEVTQINGYLSDFFAETESQETDDESPSFDDLLGRSYLTFDLTKSSNLKDHIQLTESCPLTVLSQNMSK